MSSTYIMAFQVSCAVPRKSSSSPNTYHYLKASISFSSAAKPSLKELVDTLTSSVSDTLKKCTANMLDSFVDSVFEFVDEPLLPSQSNFAPVAEVGEPVVIANVKGNIPDNFPQGVYVRNGANPLFGSLKSTKSVFGKSNYYWVEGEGMLHSLSFQKDSSQNWTIRYNNQYVETDSLKQEKQRNKPSFIPITEGDVPAVIVASLVNLLRFGKANKNISNTNLFMHSGKCYSIAENNMPIEIDVSTLETLGNWDIISRAWNRTFTSHPKIDPITGELIIIGIDAIKPYLELGIISADGKRLVHRADLKLDRGTFNHEVGITERYNVIMDFPLTLDLTRFLCGGSLLKFNKEEYARIGVMPRYGDANSIKWFSVDPSCTFHLFNCFEDDDEVVVWGCKALESVIPGPSQENFNASVKEGLLYDRPYEWRLNMKSGEAKECNLTSNTELSMDFPMINASFTGIKNKYGYSHVVDSVASAAANHMPKFGGLAKLHFEESNEKSSSSSAIKVEYHMFEKSTFCTGSTFVPKQGGLEEDDGWLLTFVHNEDTNISQIFVIDAKAFSGEPVVKITLPRRVPYGFHGAFIPAQEHK